MPPSAEGFSGLSFTLNRMIRQRLPDKQPGDQAHRLEADEHPDHVFVHSPQRCVGYAQDLTEVVAIKEEIRQVFDLPEVGAVVTEHQAQTKRCSRDVVATPPFPFEAPGPTWCGLGVRALLIYHVVAQHLPIVRATEVFRECCGITISTGFAISLAGEADEGHVDFITATRAAVRQGPTLQLDETGTRLAGKFRWLHSATTNSLTSHLCHRRRGRVAIDQFGVLPGYRGIAVHDACMPYRRYDASVVGQPTTLIIVISYH